MRSIRLFGCLTCTSLALVLILGSARQSEAQPASNLRFTVIKDDNNKPVRNASVILHPVEKDGKQARGGFQLKTDADGKAETDGLPYGMLRVQVLAHGFQTFGQDYDINKPEMDIDIRLKRPTAQLSIYDKPQGKSQSTPAPPTEPKPQ